MLRIKHQAHQITYLRTMAFVAPLPPYPNSLAFRAACDKSWFMSPSLWTRHVVTSTISDTGEFSNSLEYKTIMFLQEMEVLPESVPPCPTCQQPFSSLYESTYKRKLKKGKKGQPKIDIEKLIHTYIFRSSQKGGRKKADRCTECYGTKKHITLGTNLHQLHNLPAFIHLYILMNDNYNHEIAKKTIKDAYGVTKPETLNQWVVWILQVNHVYV